VSLYDPNIYSPSPSTHYLIVGLGENTKARSDSFPGRGTSRDEAPYTALRGG